MIPATPQKCFKWPGSKGHVDLISRRSLQKLDCLPPTRPNPPDNSEDDNDDINVFDSMEVEEKGLDGEMRWRKKERKRKKKKRK